MMMLYGYADCKNLDDMRKTISLIFAALAFISCSKDDEPTEDAVSKQVQKIAAILDGTFVSNDDTNAHELVFTPYASPKKEEFTIPGEYADIEKKVTVYGECRKTEHYAASPVITDWKYIVNIAYEGAQPELWLYPIGIYGRYETYDISIVNNTTFILDNKTYYKQ